MDNQENQYSRIAELLQESGDDTSFTELNQLLRLSEENRAFASQYLIDSDSLKELLATDEMQALATGHPTKPFSKRRPSKPHALAFAILACAASIAFVGALFWGLSYRGPIAAVHDEANAVFAQGSAPQDGKLGKKTYSLVSGMIAVEFRNGVSMTVKAPAEFEIINAFRVKLNRGQVRAMAPESGYGFVIETPDIDIQDLGTEFGVSVDADSGDSEVYVFDGRVDLKNHGEKETIAALEFGQSARIADGQVDLDISTRTDQFLDPADVSFSRWQQKSAAVRSDEDVIFYYGFNEQRENDRLLKDEATNGKPIDGLIQGARWVSGRWPGKQALLFDRTSDAVSIDIPGELPHFTFAAWVNLDRFDEAKTALFNSKGWKPGAVHLQISRSRQTFSAGTHPRSRKTQLGAKIPLGRWAFLVAVVDTHEMTATTWINGQPSMQAHFDDIRTVTPGSCLLGSNSPRIGKEHTRGFQGRIDEVILWKKALSKAEIRKLYRAGRPGPHIPKES